MVALTCLLTLNSFSQEPILDNWWLNTTDKTSSYWEVNNGPQGGYTYSESATLADVLSICYDTDTVWITSEGMTNDMGQFSNPGAPSGQGYTFGFPRNPAKGTGDDAAPESNMIGVLTNGIPIYGLGDGKSYDKGSNSNSPMGQGLWVGEAYFSEGETLDTAFAAHPQQDGAYHSHATPFRLYDDPSTEHSALVGFANDGYPVYGPFGYTTADDENSGLTRMTSSYQLRTISTRTTLPDGSESKPSGPDVTTNGDFDIGTYIQDYEYVEGLGILDEHNGRYCVTPEYPNGTYAYFVTVSEVGVPVFPYYIGTTYYGTPKAENNSGTAVQGSGLTCKTEVTSANEEVYLKDQVDFYPNPSTDKLNISLPEDANGKFDIRVIDYSSRMVYSESMVDANDPVSINTDGFAKGVYNVRIIGYNQLYTFTFIKE